MPATQPWVPDFDFAADLAGTNLINAAALQSQLVELSAWSASLSTDLAEVIRDDNTLVDDIVRLRNLHPEIETLLRTIAEGTVTTQAVEYKYPVRLLSDSNIAALNGNATIDGVAAVTGDEVLLVGQTNAAENGLWVVDTTGDWARRSDVPDAAASGDGWAVCVLEGTAWAGSAWMLNLPGTVGIDDLGFTAIIEPMASAIGRSILTAATAIAARTAIAATGKKVATITGDGSAVQFTISNSLLTANCVWRIADSNGDDVQADVRITASNIIVTFNTAPALAEVLTLTVVG